MKKSPMKWLVPAIVASVAATAGAGEFQSLEITHHDLDVKISPASHRLEATDRIAFTDVDGSARSFYLGNTLRVTRARLDGRKVRLDRSEPDTGGAETVVTGEQRDDHLDNRFVYTLPRVEPGEHVLEVSYEGAINDTLTVPDDSRAGIAEETTGLIGEDGTYLSGFYTGWYPDGVDLYTTFSIRVTTPAGTEVVTEGKRRSVERGEESNVTVWEARYPTQDVTLMAAGYVVRETEVAGTTVMAYFFPSEEELIDTYLEASGKYIELYNRLIGPYPFSKFAVVENFFPTGYGMPSYTLLGRRIVRMPFIVKTSLGHEVVHNWWGNGVYPDYDRGNWCEGLTVYYADYRYESEKSDSSAAAYRRDINVDYATEVTDSTDIPLIRFQTRKDAASGTIGYGKCMMVFHMLARRTGEDRFYRTMRNFYRRYLFERADWDDIEAVFEESLEEPLDDFFDQWVRGTGAPELALAGVALEESPGDDGFRLRVSIANRGGFELSNVPVHISGPGVTRRIHVTVDDTLETFDWRLEERPMRLEVDPDHHVFRKLAPAEIPATIGRALADNSPVIVLPGKTTEPAKKIYRTLAERLANTETTRIENDSDVDLSDLSSSAVFILGNTGENSAWQLLSPPEGVTFEARSFGLGGNEWSDPGNAAFVAFANPLDDAHTVCAIFGNSENALEAAGYKVIYYGKYSYVTFLDGKKQKTGVFPALSGPLVYEFETGDFSAPRPAAGE